MRELDTVGVVGLGTMGAGIAQLCIEAGLETVAYEAVPGKGEAARDRIGHFLARKVEKGDLDPDLREEALARLHLASSLDQLAPCAIVVEAVFEELAVKGEVVAALDEAAPEAILATNTSALPVGAIAEASVRPERVVGMHFFNPAPLMKLVEVVRAEQSSDEAVETAEALAIRLGRTPIICADTPGFVVNRVLIPLLNDCIRVLDETGVSPADLDQAMTLGAGWPLGPCALVDLVGIDVHLHATEALHTAFGEERYEPPERLLELAAQGKLGRKTNEGFFTY
jgi:3-hydroxybutyryl-CoA dehydrogenase